MRLVLRPTTRADLSAVTRLERAAETAPWLAQTGTAWHRGALADPAQDHRVLTQDGRVVGFVVLADAPGSSLELRRVVVQPTLRGRGVGRALVRASLDRARERGCRRVFLDVADGNVRARNLYAAMGFVEVELPQGYVSYDVPEGFAVMAASFR